MSPLMVMAWVIYQVNTSLIFRVTPLHVLHPHFLLFLIFGALEICHPSKTRAVEAPAGVLLPWDPWNQGGRCLVRENMTCLKTTLKTATCLIWPDATAVISAWLPLTWQEGQDPLRNPMIPITSRRKPVLRD